VAFDLYYSFLLLTIDSSIVICFLWIQYFQFCSKHVSVIKISVYLCKGATTCLAAFKPTFEPREFLVPVQSRYLSQYFSLQ